MISAASSLFYPCNISLSTGLTHPYLSYHGRSQILVLFAMALVDINDCGLTHLGRWFVLPTALLGLWWSSAVVGGLSIYPIALLRNVGTFGDIAERGPPKVMLVGPSVCAYYVVTKDGLWNDLVCIRICA